MSHSGNHWANRCDQGQATAFITILMSAFVLCLGLVYDGGQVLRTKDRATVLAQEAARAGAQQIDWAAYREGEGATLDPLAAGRAARAFLADTGTGGTVSVSGETVTVTCSLSHDFTLLPLGSVTVDGTASARPFSEPTP